MLVFGGVYTATNQGPPTLLTAQLVLTLENLLVWSVEIVDSVTNSRLPRRWNQPPENEQIWNPKVQWRFSVFRKFFRMSILGAYFFWGAKRSFSTVKSVFALFSHLNKSNMGTTNSNKISYSSPWRPRRQKVLFSSQKVLESPTCKRLTQLFQEI